MVVVRHRDAGSAQGAQVTLERGFWIRSVVAVAIRPGLWVTALRALLRVARPGWWRRPPFLPLPDAGYLGFRLDTAYGRDGVARAADLFAYLRWCRERRD